MKNKTTSHKNKKTKKSTLSGFIIRKYVRLTIVMLILLSLVDSIFGVALTSSTAKIIEQLNAQIIVQDDYTMIDTSTLEDVSGWMEILDDEYQVIYTKGNVLEITSQYTLNDLLDLMSPFSVWSGEVSGLIPFISIYISSYAKDYFATAAVLTGPGGKEYICILKIPTSVVQTTMKFNGITGPSLYLIYLITAAMTFSALIVIVLLLIRYTRGVKKHLQEPNRKLVDGLELVTQGNYDVKLNLEAEYEYTIIENSFNFMVQDLKDARAKNQIYEQERQQLFSSIAHDLRTPVTSIKGCAQALSEGIVTDTAKQHEYLTTIQAKSERISELMELLMVYTKLNHNEFELKKERTDFCEYILNIVAENYNEFENHGMELEAEIPEEELYTEIDRIEFGRVVTNLLSNALRHNPEGTQIKIKVFQDEDHLILQVWDNGTKIPENMIETLFKPFVLGDESRTSKNGSGLGLSVCKKIVERHDGQLELRIDEEWKYFHITL